MSQLKESNFSITCDRLNRYLKEKKKSIPENIGGLHLNPSAQDSDSTLELFPVTELNKPFTAKSGTKQLTILYKGAAVNYENIEAKKVEELIAFAKSITALREVGSNVVMPTTRRKSLQRFLQKRKDRISSNVPYSSKQAACDDKSWLQLSL